MKTTILFLLFCSALFAGTMNMNAQGTAFTYQGRLFEGAAPANGVYDLTFTLFNSANGGAVVGASNVVNDLVISNGWFAVTLDPGAGVFAGAARWLQIAVRPGASPDSFTNLTPRQAVTPTPYSIYAATATSAAGFTGPLAGNVTGPQGANVVASVGGQTAANVAAGASAANAATSAATANTLVRRDASGNFSAATVTARLVGNATTATTATNLIGAVSDAQLSTNIARLNGSNAFIGTNTFAGRVLLTNLNNVVSGNGTGLTNLNASKLGTGTVPLDRLPATVVTNNETGVNLSGSFTGSLTGAASGSLLSATNLAVNLTSLSSAPANTWTKVGDIGSFTKQAASRVEITYNGRLCVGAWGSGAMGADFELRTDGAAGGSGRARATVATIDSSSMGISVAMTGLFTGLGAGSHTISIWVHGYNGTVNSVQVNPGNFNAAHVVVNEFK
jgi:hypothetical protein